MAADPPGHQEEEICCQAKCTVARTEDGAVCRIAGDLDATAAPGIREMFSNLRDGAAVVFDLAGVPSIDAAGLRALVGGIRGLAGLGVDVSVCGLRPRVERLVRLAGLERVVPLYRAPVVVTET